MYAYVVKPHPLRDGGFKISKPRGPEGWGIYNFKNPGALRGGGFAFSWGNPNTKSTKCIILTCPPCTYFVKKVPNFEIGVLTPAKPIPLNIKVGGHP